MLHTRGIVFRTVKYGETSIIADIYTEAKGLQSFIGGSVRSAKSAMPYSMFQPMQVIELVSYYKDQGKALHRLKEVRLSEYFEQIPFDVKRGAIVLFMAEVLRKCIKDAQEDTDLFHFLLDTLQLLDRRDAPLTYMPAWFLVRLTEFFGFQPASEIAPDGNTIWFDLRDGNTTHDPQPYSEQLTPEVTAHLFTLLHTSVDGLADIQMTSTDRRALLDGLLKYYEYHVDAFGKVNAHEVLNTVFHG